VNRNYVEGIGERQLQRLLWIYLSHISRHGAPVDMGYPVLWRGRAFFMLVAGRIVSASAEGWRGREIRVGRQELHDGI
jgi:hypothetical protein